LRVEISPLAPRLNTLGSSTLGQLDAVGSTPKGHPPNPPSLSLGTQINFEKVD
jgi:hypothetical protein